MHINAFLQSTPVVLFAAVGTALLAFAAATMRSSCDRALRVLRHRADVGSSAAHGLGLVVFSPVGVAGLSCMSAFFALQLLHPAYDTLGRPIAVHFELLPLGMALAATWWALGYLPRVPAWLLPCWAQTGETRLTVIAARLVHTERSD